MKSSLALTAAFFVLVLMFTCFAQSEERQKNCKNDPDLLLEKNGVPALFSGKSCGRKSFDTKRLNIRKLAGALAMFRCWRELTEEAELIVFSS